MLDFNITLNTNYERSVFYHMQEQTRKKTILQAIIILILSIGIIGIVSFAYHAGKAQNLENAKGIVVSEDAMAWDKDLNNLSGEQKGIQIPGYSDISIASGEKAWKITLANPKDNDCYFKYEITIDDETTPIYESDLIEPGKAITEFEVSKALDAGDYDICFHIATYSMDGENTRLNGADVKALLHVI